MKDTVKIYGAGVDFAPTFAKMKPLWADAPKVSIESIGTTAGPQFTPSGDRPNLPAYQLVTDERPWRPGPR